MLTLAIGLTVYGIDDVQHHFVKNIAELAHAHLYVLSIAGFSLSSDIEPCGTTESAV